MFLFCYKYLLNLITCLFIIFTYYEIISFIADFIIADFISVVMSNDYSQYFVH